MNLLADFQPDVIKIDMHCGVIQVGKHGFRTDRSFGAARFSPTPMAAAKAIEFARGPDGSILSSIKAVGISRNPG